MKFMTLVAVVLSLSAVSQADTKARHSAAKASSESSFTRNYGMAGCGLGSQVMGKSGSQILAWTTNATAYNQLFAITSGTSNCVDADSGQAAHRMDLFINANKTAVASDIAKGQGETIKTMAGILHCSNDGRLSTALQGNFSRIFPKYDVQAMDVTDSIITVIKNDSQLNQSCQIHG